MHPTWLLSRYVFELGLWGYDVSRSYVAYQFRAWNWTFKIPHHKVIYKYAADNLSYYVDFVFWMSYIPWEKIHYLDEASYNVKNLRRRRGISAKGEAVHDVDMEVIDGTYNTTVFTSYSNNNNVCPIVVNIREEVNDSWAFLAFLAFLIEAGHLPRGHVLVMDNAKIHFAAGIMPVMMALLQAAEVRLIFMPKYSPELDAAEFVHGFVKRHIREYGAGRKLLDNIVLYHTLVSMPMMRRWYRRTLMQPFDPEFRI